MLKNWLKIYIHHAIKNKAFTLLTILGLAIGIAGVIFSTLYWKDENSYDQWNPYKDRVFETLTIDHDFNETIETNVAPLAKVLLNNKADKIENFCYYYPWYDQNIVTINNKKEFLNKIIETDNNFFQFFPFPFINGNQKDFENNQNSVAIEEQEAIRLFGKKNPINQIIENNDGEKFIINGIFQLKKPSSIEPKYIFSSIHKKIKIDENNWNNYSYGLLLKLKNTNNKDDINNAINNIYHNYVTVKNAKEAGTTVEKYVKDYGNTLSKLQSLNDARFSKEITGFPEGKTNTVFLAINLGLSFLILILSIINYINISSAKMLRRVKEVGVRKILGASKRNILYQFIFETFITTVLSTLLALTLVEILLPFYNQLINKNLELNIIHFLPYILLITSFVNLFSAVFPALYLANLNLIKIIKGNYLNSKDGLWLRNIMLIIQFSIAAFFISTSYIVTEQIKHLTKKDLGLNSDQIISISFKNYTFDNGKKFEFFKNFKPDLLKIKGVKDINVGTFKFGTDDGISGDLTFNEKNILATNIATDFGLLKLLDIKLINGRDFNSKISSDTIESVIVNETAQKLLGKELNINSVLNWNNKKFRLIGIVKDFNLGGPDTKIPPMLLMNLKTVDWIDKNIRSVFVKIEPENANETIAAIESFWKKNIDKDYPFEYEFVNQQYARSYELYTKQEKMFKILNVIVITIALFGLFALSSYTIERKYKEIAIRKVLGAETSSLLKILSKQYIYLAIIGFFIAIFPSYFLMQNWLENFAYRIEISPWVYVFAFVLLLSLTLIVVLLKAFFATKINILKYIKYE